MALLLGGIIIEVVIAVGFNLERYVTKEID